MLRSTNSKAPEALKTISAVFALLKGFRRDYTGLVFVSALTSATEGIVHPLLVKSIFDQVVNKVDLSRLAMLVLVYMAVGVLVNASMSATSLWNKSLENRIAGKVGRLLLASYYDKNYATILKLGQGYFITRIYGDINEGLIPLLALFRDVVSQTFLLLASSLILTLLSWRAFALLALLIPLSAGAGHLLAKKIRSLASQEREQEGTVIAILTHAIAAFRTIRNFKLIPKTIQAFDARFGEYLSTTYQRYKIIRLFQSLNDLTMTVSDFLSLSVGALFVFTGSITFGSYLAFVNTFWRTVTTLTKVLSSIANFHSLGAITERIFSFLYPDAHLYYRYGLTISVDSLRFSYGETLVLKDLSFRIYPGEKVVLVGRNGSGKTTLANVLSGNLAPSTGDIVLPEKISSITLPIYFPPLKVKEIVDDAELLSLLQLHEQEILNASADGLSVGQQQKLAIALLLSQKADLYIVDEPLANLDFESRDAVVDLLLERTGKQTLIVVMHGCGEYYHRFDKVIRIDRVNEMSTAEMMS